MREGKSPFQIYIYIYIQVRLVLVLVEIIFPECFPILITVARTN